VAHGREPRLAGGDDAAGEFLLESVARHRVAVRRFEPRARDRELAALQDREAALGERPLQEPRQADVPPDRLAAYPVSGRVGPWDLAATMLAALGIDPASEATDALGRPFPLAVGRSIAGLYSA